MHGEGYFYKSSFFLLDCIPHLAETVYCNQVSAEQIL